MTASVTASSPLNESAQSSAPAASGIELQWFSLAGTALATPAGLFAVLLVYAGIWLALTPYAGLSHDAQAYALQALARLHPDVFAQELFLRYRSQDEFSVFTALYAPVVGLLGLENAAAILTFACHVAWFGFAYLIVRRLFGQAIAILALGLLVSLPGVYGGLRVFHVAEPFFTARLPAEVLSLAAIWFALSSRHVASAAALAIALPIHPLMTFPVALVIALFWLWPRVSIRTVVGLLIAGVGIAIAGAYVLGQPTPVMEDRWLVMSRLRSAFLFLDQWQPADWNHTLQTLLTIALAAVVLESRDAKRLALVALCVAASGLFLAVVSTYINLEVLLQGQPWRWIWPCRVLAIALLPATMITLWQSGLSGRTAALLVGVGWTMMTPVSLRTVPILMLGSLLTAASLAVWAFRDRTPQDAQRLLHRGSWAVALFGLLGSLATIWLAEHVHRVDSERSSEPVVVMLLSFITPAIIMAVGVWALSLGRRRWLTTPVIAAAGIGLIAAALPDASDRWFGREYSPAAVNAFASWREQIPETAEVFWWEQLQETWFLLQRRSYLTLSQGGGLVFSEPLADEIARRALVLEPLVDPNFWINLAQEDPDEPRALTRSKLTAVCRDPELGFVISEVDLGTGAPAKHWPEPTDVIYLYDCNDFRG